MDHIKDAIGIFDSERNLEAAIDTLLISGFNRADLSLLAGEKTISERLGHSYENIRELEDDPSAPAVAYVSKESMGDAKGALIGAPMYVIGVTAAGAVAAAGGTLMLSIAAIAAGAGAGTAIGVALARLFGRKHSEFIEKQLDHGGLLLWVRTWSEAEEGKATEILKSNHARDVHIFDFSAHEEAVTSPASILKSEKLSDTEKVSLLKRWEYDIREMLVAEDEGMGDCNGGMLSQIHEALSALGVEQDVKHWSPTKQGGN